MEFAIDKLEDLGLRPLAEMVLEQDEKIINLEDEIERLNNIINELEKYLFKQLQLYGGGGIVQEHYDKLQELKESK